MSVPVVFLYAGQIGVRVRGRVGLGLMAQRGGPLYDVLLLDFGGVCLLNPVELHSYAETRLGLEPGSLTWLGPIDPSTDELWQRMIAGDGLNERGYWAQRAAEVGAAAGIELDTRGYMTLLFDPPRAGLVRPEATAVVEAAKGSGFTVAVLTNDMRAFHGREWEAGIDFLGLVDHIVDCSDTGILKPDPRAYERAISTTGAAAERTLFVDDQPLNIEGAQAVGMHTHWFDIANASQSWWDVAAALNLPVSKPTMRP